MSETTRAAPTGKTIPGRCGIPTGSPTRLRSRGRRSGTPRREMSKLFQRRQAQGSRGSIAARRCGVAREKRSVHPERQAPCGCVAQASRPEVERSTGARVVGRLQKSGRSILLVFDEGSREANRGDAGQHGAAPSPSTGAGQSDAVGESRRSADARAGRKGATKLRGNVTGNAKPTHSVSRPRLEPTEGALGCFLRRL
jgi:hypothetical protein